MAHARCFLQIPTEATWRPFVEAQQYEPLSYSPAGMTNAPAPPAGFSINARREPLGRGERDFAAAVAALQRWTMFDLSWARVLGSEVPPATGQNVGVLVRAAGLWWLSSCRVLATIDTATPVRRVGFVYGTLPAHAECGEERFAVELQADGAVLFDLLAYSRPRHPLARLAAPWTRRLQRRFAEDAGMAMLRAVAEARNAST